MWGGGIEKTRSFLAVVATQLLSLTLEEKENNDEYDETRRDASRRKHTRQAAQHGPISSVAIFSSGDVLEPENETFSFYRWSVSCFSVFVIFGLWFTTKPG